MGFFYSYKLLQIENNICYPDSRKVIFTNILGVVYEVILKSARFNGTYVRIIIAWVCNCL